MKTLILLAFAWTVAFVPMAPAAGKDKIKPAKNRAKVTQTATRHVKPVGPRNNPRTVQTKQFRQKIQSTARVHKNPIITNADVTRQTDVKVRNKKNWENPTRQHATVQNQNSRNRISNNSSWEEARRHRHREHHHRDWWRSRFSRFALFGSGYYYWNNGFWYPAYGYDSGYNTYAYDEPIYGYANLDPGQVIANVQTELQRLGYYRYAVDGLMGPATRAALADYQRDRGLSITSAVDEPTLNSLGLG